MPPSTQGVRAQRVYLIELPTDTLKKETSGCVREMELCEYRRDHIYIPTLNSSTETPPRLLTRAAKEGIEK